MANSANPIKQERVWDGPLPVNETVPVSVSSSNETILINQTLFLQQNPDCIYTYLKDMHKNNRRVTAYTLGFMFIGVCVLIFFTPYLIPDMAFSDIANIFLLTGVVMFVIGTIAAVVKI